MPALQQEYDYYEYARRRQGTVRTTVPYSAAHKSNNTSKKVASRSSVNTRATTKNLNLKTTTTRDITRNATRVATRDDNFIGARRKTSTSKTNTKNNTSKNRTTSKKASIDPVVFNSKKNIKKPQEMTLTKPKTSVKSKAMQKQKAKVKEMLKNFVTVSMIFGMLFLICYRYSVINEAFSELNELKSELKNKQTINAQMESNIKQNTDLAYIENYAKYQLGMQKPKDSQIQKISIGKQDKIILPIEIEEKEDDNFFQNLIADVRKILD